MKNIYRVAVLVESTATFGRGLCRGIGLFAQEHPDWHLTYAPMALGRQWPLWFKEWQGDGILVRAAKPRLLLPIRAKRVPFVDLCDKKKMAPHAGTIDPCLAAKLVVDFFIAAGFRHFAFCGTPGLWYFSDKRSRAFVEGLRQQGFTCSVYRPPRPLRRYNSAEYADADYERETKWIATWLRPLPKPLAVWACDDLRGMQVINACWRAGLRVPDDVAVMGVDDDEMICNLCTPPLSSVKPDCERMGYLAAQYLDALMRGHPPKHSPSYPPLIGIIERASTDLMAINHPVVAEALRHIRHELKDGVSVKALVATQGLTRITLDALFVKHTGLTISGVLQRERLRRARILLQEGRRTVADVARAVGFHSVAQFVATFRRRFGLTPHKFQTGKKPLI